MRGIPRCPNSNTTQFLDFIVRCRCSSGQDINVRGDLFHQITPAGEIDVKQVELLFTTDNDIAQIEITGRLKVLAVANITSHMIALPPFPSNRQIDLYYSD